MRKIKKIPRFRNEDEEGEFWATHDTTEYFDLFKPVKLDLSKLKPSTESISLRLPGFLLMRIKELASPLPVLNEDLFGRKGREGAEVMQINNVYSS